MEGQHLQRYDRKINAREAALPFKIISSFLGIADFGLRVPFSRLSSRDLWRRVCASWCVLNFSADVLLHRAVDGCLARTVREDVYGAIRRMCANLRSVQVG